MNYQNIIDISPVISSRMAVFPGDIPFSRNIHLDMIKGDNIGLSSIQTTVHIGAHADSPSHYAKEGAGIDQRSLHYYLGGCQVIEVELARGERIYPHHLIQKNEDKNNTQDKIKIEQIKIEQKRILFKTKSFPDPEHWNGDFNSCSPELIEYLAKQGVILIGIDTPSIDPADSKDLESHQSILKNDIAVLEGLVLDHVEVGSHYSLIALPLKIEKADASPVRAVLIRE